MKNFLTTILALCLFIGCTTKPAKVIEPAIVPEPQSMTVEMNKHYALNGMPALMADNETASQPMSFLNDFLKTAGWSSHIAKEGSAEIHFEAKAGMAEEAYELSVNATGVHIRASHESGFFYGVQSLIQMLPPGKQIANLPYLEIQDEPRFQWRGLHLDVGRHFFPPDFIKKYIDLMAFYKFNTFHWHLTEDQGWRIEIKQYPKLTEIGSQRKETILEKNFDPYVGDGQPYGGFYTQEEVKEIVAYAQERQVTIVPEIEMPGHSLAALAAYPELGCAPGPYEVGTVWGVYDDIYCPSELTFEFLENVLTEVMALFPSKYIHVGGDEAPKTAWKKSKVAQEVIRREGLKDEFELQSYFIQRIEKFLNANGRQLIGWDEILEGGLAPGAAVMSWRGEAGGIEAAEAEHYVVMTPNGDMYFDHYQADPENEPLAIGGFTTVESVYHYEPIPQNLDEAHHQYILGAQANVWTEYMKTSDHVEYMVYPRAVALAETVWSNPENKDWDKFQKKLKYQYKLLDARDVNYHVAAPAGLRQGLTLENEMQIELSTPYDGAEIYYTEDGSEPTANSTLYKTPIRINIAEKPVEIKAVTITATGKSSPVVSGTYQKAELLESVKPLKMDAGLSVRLIEGNFNSVRRIGGRPNRTYVAESIVLPQEQPDQFGLIMQGFINVPTDGIYTFYTSSDDGSTLSIGNEMIVNNDGLHGAQERMGEVALKAGSHPLLIRYFEAGGGEGLKAYISGPGIEKQEIPASMLGH
ncbi:family 20 glycosylhydrolase [Roseivirga sp.]|uniref:family 20 glycosylhydrolase n=1 Tax=Roseivirga sp. TaxID=1964215 RepID=UPI003B52E3B2